MSLPSPCRLELLNVVENTFIMNVEVLLEHNLVCFKAWLVIGRYGVGYHMVMEKTPSSTTEKVVEVVSLMQSHVRGAKCVVDAGAELAFILPAGETSAFPTLFQELESNGRLCCTQSTVRLYHNRKER